MAKSQKGKNKIDITYKPDDSLNNLSKFADIKLIPGLDLTKMKGNKTGMDKLMKVIREPEPTDPLIQSIINKHTSKETKNEKAVKISKPKQDDSSTFYLLLAGAVVVVILIAVPFHFLLGMAWGVVRYFLLWCLIAAIGIILFNR